MFILLKLPLTKFPWLRGITEDIGMISKGTSCFCPPTLCPSAWPVIYTKCEQVWLFVSLVYNQGIYDPNNFFL